MFTIPNGVSQAQILKNCGCSTTNCGTAPTPEPRRNEYDSLYVEVILPGSGLLLGQTVTPIDAGGWTAATVENSYSRPRGIITGISGDLYHIVLEGMATDVAGLTAGREYFVAPGNPGGITTIENAGARPVYVGYAMGDNRLLVGMTNLLLQHAPSHSTGGSDPITPADIGAATVAALAAIEAEAQAGILAAAAAQSAANQALADANQAYNLALSGASEASAAHGAANTAQAAAIAAQNTANAASTTASQALVTANAAFADVAGAHAAANAAQADIDAHVADLNNPHQTTKAQVGLGNVQNVDTTNAANITSGVLDPARLPVILVGAGYEISSGGLADLTVEQQSHIAANWIVTTTDGKRWLYTGSGDKTLSASYIEMADVTPDWSVIANKPLSFTPSAHAASHAVAGSDPITITKDQVGLGNVPNIDYGVAELWRKVIHVAKNGTDTRAGISKYSAFSPYLTVQAAIDAASSGDVVFVHYGTYEERVTMKFGIELHGDGALITWPSSGAFAQPTFSVGAGLAGESCRIKGLRIQTTPAGYDSALKLATNYALVTVEECEVIATTGAGICCTSNAGFVEFLNCRFRSEFQGITFGGCTATLRNSSIEFAATNFGAFGLGIFSGAKVVVTDTPITMVGVSDGSVVSIGYNGVDLRMSNCVLSGQCSRLVYLYTTNSALRARFDNVQFLSSTAPAALQIESDCSGIVSMTDCTGNKPLSTGTSSLVISPVDYLENSSL